MWKSNLTFNPARLHLKSAVTISKARLDIKAGGFWARGARQVTSKCYQNKTTSEVFKEQENQKRHKYQQRVLDGEASSFTPLVFGTNGGMGNQFQHFLKHLTYKIAQKDTEPYNTVITWLRMQISFKILRSAHLHERLTNSFSQKIEHSLNYKISIATAGIQSSWGSFQCIF